MEFFGDRLRKLRAAGVQPEQVVLDPGIGFGKNRQHNLQLLAQLNKFHPFERPILLGVSRKSFLGRWGGAGPEERLAAGLAVSCWAAQAGIQMIRTHDVRATWQAVRMAEEILHESAARA